MSKVGYVAMMCTKTIPTNLFPVDMETDEVHGVAYIFKTKKAARKVYGNKVELQIVRIGEHNEV